MQILEASLVLVPFIEHRWLKLTEMKVLQLLWMSNKEPSFSIKWTSLNTKLLSNHQITKSNTLTTLTLMSCIPALLTKFKILQKVQNLYPSQKVQLLLSSNFQLLRRNHQPIETTALILQIRFPFLKMERPPKATLSTKEWNSVML